MIQFHNQTFRFQIDSSMIPETLPNILPARRLPVNGSTGGMTASAKWDVLVDGKIHNGLDTAAVQDLIRSNRLAADSMIRAAGGAWRKVLDFPELVPVVAPHVAETRRAQHQEYAYWKGLVVATPLAATAAAWANIYNPFIENWGQFAEALVPVLVEYLVLFVGATVFINWYHHHLLRQGNHWGFWRYSRAGAIGVVLGILMFLIGCPPYLPFLPILSEILSAELLIIAIVMVFRLVFEKKFKVENA